MVRGLLKIALGAGLAILALVGLAVVVPPLSAPEPPLMTAEHVQPWPFTVDAVEVWCCRAGQVTLAYNDQRYEFNDGRFSVVRLAKPGLSLDDFEPARKTAYRIARERWPEDVR